MRRLIVCALGLGLIVSGCGGGDEPVGPPPPAAVATLSVTPAEFALVVGDTSQLTVELKDATGATLTGRTVTYSSSDAAVASVNSSGMVTGLAAGTATITATSEGKSGTATTTVTDPPFSPTENTALSGDQAFSSVSIPAGTTVTLTADANITVAGPVDIQGDIAGDCIAFAITGTSVTVTGTVNNECSAAADSPPDLRLISQGDITITGATLVSSGNIDITNDTTLAALSDEAFDALPAAAAGFGAAAAAHTCTINGLAPVTGDRRKAKNGTASGTNGGDAKASRRWRLDCSGNINATGGTIRVPNGGDGGDGTDENVTDPDKTEVKGGQGGNGGPVRIRATGNISFKPNGNGVPFKIQLSSGGFGGSATMVATSPGGSASAFGGDGGTPGSLRVRANGGISIAMSGLEIIVGKGGHGGGGWATAADGADAGSAAAQPGGGAGAIGGKGGSTPDVQLRARGNVTGAANITMTGGNAGNGGDAMSKSGMGGSGNQSFPDGAVGGPMSARGGDGGNALTRDLTGGLIGKGGDAGDAMLGTFVGQDGTSGRGGDGWNGCSVSPTSPGGNGGSGGNALGGDGIPGTGLLAGAPGEVRAYDATGSGGDGGDGNAPGSGGFSGTNNTTVRGSSSSLGAGGPSFSDGNDGNNCPTINVTTLPTAFDHTVGVTPCPTTIGTFVISNPSGTASMSWTVGTSAPLAIRHNGTAGTTQTGTLAPGQTVELIVEFDCSQTTSFTQTVRISTTSSGGSETKEVTITGTVG
jgi:Bacterial Ig-like domain (group 2)